MSNTTYSKSFSEEPIEILNEPSLTDKVIIENPPKGKKSYWFSRKLINKDIEVEKEWNRKWKDIVMRDGKLNLEQVKMELFDYSLLMMESSTVYNFITGGRVKTPNYFAEGVLIAFKEHLKNLTDEEIALIRSNH